ncbi:hypothetical protein SCP_0405020 [Sparassis crispa]|uniref:Cytidyltransferase-like domain-containing protein n=1 Tax=Sparassis crispa TaxID=139825 RepID=A0A401GIX4_9APHY|nr:hypothetical protein SCP_0405020 [Sparassis crispa]GBE82122.1 hypothetical protein SCP_0405020 [Sparassis crispa]
MDHIDPTSLEPVASSVLFAYIQDLYQPPNFLASSVLHAAKTTTKRLRIYLISPFFDVPRRNAGADAASEAAGISHTKHWYGVQRLLTFVYVQATKVAQDSDRVLMDIDVLLKGSKDVLSEKVIQDAQRIFCVLLQSGGTPDLPLFLRQRTDIISLPPDDHPLHSLHPIPPAPDPSVPPMLHVVALGGTFDHLHAGHKILLSMGAWIASEKLIVGITDDALLKKKIYKEVLESLSVRTERTRTFLELFKPGLVYDIVPISDVYGPTGWDPNIQGLVVSKETLPGASSIHKWREEKRLPPLHTFVIDVISSTEASVDDDDAEVLKKTKMSSTYIREWIVNNEARTVQP